MKRIERASKRLMRQLTAIDRKEFYKIIAEMLDEYGAPSGAVNRLPTLWSVSDEQYYRTTGERIHAIADTHMPTYYTPSILKASKEEPFECIVLHLHCHETMHYLGRRILKRKVLRPALDDEPEIRIEQRVSGFRVTKHLVGTELDDEDCHEVRFHFLNEAATEFLARKLFLRCKGRIEIRNIAKERVEQYVEEISDNRAGFYPIPVNFLERLLTRFHLKRDESLRQVVSFLVRSYAHGTDIRVDPQWQSYLHDAQLPVDFVQELEKASEKKLNSMIRRPHFILNPAIGHVFDDIEVTEI